MGFLDKLKNVLFEEIEEEEKVEQPPVKLAKKIELPKRKVEKVVEKTEPVVSRTVVNEKIVNDDVHNSMDTFVEEEEEFKPVENVEKMPMMFEEEDFFNERFNESVKEEVKPVTREEKLEKRELYQGKKETTYVESVNKTPSYTYTKSYYESKETKGFKPTPIISPIYGILDKNYRKEEVVTKKEIRVTSSNSNKLDLDSIRNKAFGQEEKKEKKEKVEKPKETEPLVYDVNKSKPSVDKITLADADEYYNDLGLAYNVDYNDATKNRVNTSRSKRYHEEDDYKSDDNLFDLIDSMYSKED